MGSRLQAAVVRRPSLPITEHDATRLELIKESPELREALNLLIATPLPEGPVSESALLHAVFEAGLSATSSVVEEAGYAMIARSIDDSASQLKAEARRRAPSWAEEE